jgi:ATP-dependent DNA helicase RecG
MIEGADEASSLPLALPLIEDHLPPEFRATRELPELREAYRAHSASAQARGDGEPVGGWRTTSCSAAAGRARQAGAPAAFAAAPALRGASVIDARIRERFPFKLTSRAGRVVIGDQGDLSKPTSPANRLIQGDVGSGKTAVALYAMLLAVAGEEQAA